MRRSTPRPGARSLRWRPRRTSTPLLSSPRRTGLTASGGCSAGERDALRILGFRCRDDTEPGRHVERDGAYR